MDLRRAALLLVLTALPAVAAGCGDGDGASTGGTVTAPSPKVAFQNQANALCRTMQTKGKELADKADLSENQQALPDLMRQMNGVVDETVAELRKLPPPPGDEATVGAAIDALARAGAATGALADAAAKDDQLAVTQAVSAQADAQEASDRAMAAYGLTDCVFSETPPDTSGTTLPGGSSTTTVFGPAIGTTPVR